ncbi:YbdK family carboxylate-amine ligase [Microbacterium sp. H1-D42]|uniref:carboxylate-amine ligase n=1 Tax=Microbacterium sp. H1-D42 TaxID=2925844 RepID=UPI001F5343F8|nr:YbdK family carboxylate-amine ligase [Microbacterium sp. H1-D42]UNK70837.1 YbdK family carboxylate-amine ligase [Microbacterium sp. H1-D42]
MSHTRFGVEEEFILLDADALVPLTGAELGAQVLGPAEAGGRITSEYLTSQFECATDPVHTLADAAVQLSGMRKILAHHAPPKSLIAATGAPFAQSGGPAISASDHYDDVSTLLGELTRQHAVNGLHVHIEVAEDEQRVRALRRLRAHLPVLLALSTNSPFANGVPAHLASWRSVLIRRLPVSWAPPAFRDADDYHRTVDRLVRIQLLPSRASVAWAVRLSEQYPTVEVRVADAQLQVGDALLLAALMRGLVCAEDLSDATAPPSELDGSQWLAARHGMSARFFTPEGDVEDAWTACDRMLERIRPALIAVGDEEFVDERLALLRAAGTGAERQRAAYATGGTASLGTLLASG